MFVSERSGICLHIYTCIRTYYVPVKRILGNKKKRIPHNVETIRDWTRSCNERQILVPDGRER